MTQEITQAGGPVGSPAFLSPEQCRGKEADSSPRIFFGSAASCTRLFTGLHPFEGKSVINCSQYSNQRTDTISKAQSF